MRFTHITLMGYIGIYNGMKMTEISIDFPYTGNKIVLLTGDNGSGKSTIMNALSVLPDSNDCFLPYMEAQKHIILQDGPVVYDILFDHPLTNGNRGTTKAYIRKSNAVGEMIELNPNGNVSSYKEILFNELNIDANFIALSALSSENRGLAGKRPADRKKFVASIAGSLDFYNDIYKSLSRKVNDLKSMISSVSAKLGMLGNPEQIQMSLQAVEGQINVVQNEKDKNIKGLAEQQALMKLLDPNGELQTDLERIQGELKKSDALIASIKTFDKDPMTMSSDDRIAQYDEAIKETTDKLNSWSNQLALFESTVNDCITKSTMLGPKLLEYKNKVSNPVTKEDVDKLEQELTSITDEIEANTRTLMDEYGIDIANIDISDDDIKMIHQALDELAEIVKSVQEQLTFDMLDRELAGEVLTPWTDIDNLSSLIPRLNEIINYYKQSVRDYEEMMDLAINRDKIPDMCPGGCFMLYEFKKIDGMSYESIQEGFEKQSDELANHTAELSEIEETIKQHMADNQIIAYINRVKRLLSTYNNLFKKIGGSITIDIIRHPDVIDQLRDKVKKYIDSNNLIITTTKTLTSRKDSLANKLELMHSRMETDSIYMEEISKIEAEMTQAEQNRIAASSQANQAREQIDYLKRSLTMLKSNRDTACSLSDAMKQHQACVEALAKNRQKFDQIQEAITVAENHKALIIQANASLEPLFAQRDQLNHNLRLIDDYNRELAELRTNYDFIEKIRYYSSPTTGIQLVFMQYYLGNTIAMANQLLAGFFGGRFVIQPFTINETEFKIPCLGDGYMNDDISSMSSAQISMISMVISFSLLHHSSTRFNIPKLDEIDGALDTSNRLMFADVLNRIIEIMNIEQCFIISHNGELDTDKCDVICLRTSNPPMNGNVIWKY